jgi:hypothetical protein
VSFSQSGTQSRSSMRFHSNSLCFHLNQQRC